MTLENCMKLRNRSITQCLRLRINNPQKYLQFKMLSLLISISLVRFNSNIFLTTHELIILSVVYILQ